MDRLCAWEHEIVNLGEIDGCDEDIQLYRATTMRRVTRVGAYGVHGAVLRVDH
jgi:hypothetical protein